MWWYLEQKRSDCEKCEEKDSHVRTVRFLRDTYGGNLNPYILSCRSLSKLTSNQSEAQIHYFKSRIFGRDIFVVIETMVFKNARMSWFRVQYTILEKYSHKLI